MAATNLISTGYAAIWTALNNWKPFTNLVQPGLGTQQNAQDKGFSKESTANSGDRPAVCLIEGQAGSRPFQRNSKAIEMSVDYPISVLTDVFTIDKVNLLETVVLQALINADGDFPGTLGLSSIYTWVIRPGSFKQFDPKTKRPGWTLALTISVTFVVNRAVFQETVFS